MTGWLESLGIKQAAIIGGLLGSFVSLKFIEDIAHWSPWKKATTVLAGATVAAFMTPLTVEVFELSKGAEGAIAFLGGLFGMSIAGSIIREIPAIIKGVREKVNGK